MIPREGPSAGLCQLGTYLVWKWALAVSTTSCIHQKCHRRDFRLVKLCHDRYFPFPVKHNWHLEGLACKGLDQGKSRNQVTILSNNYDDVCSTLTYLPHYDVPQSVIVNDSRTDTVQ